MTDEFGFDLSRYDDEGPDGSLAVTTPGISFVILNIEDPRMRWKVARAVAIGKPWALYSWLYEGHGAESVTRLVTAVELLQLEGYPAPPKGGFVDFEANGVSTADATAARAVADSISLDVGFYTYLYLLNSLPGLADEWWRWGGRWIAYYPGNNDGNYPAGQRADAAAWGAMLWQYSSTDGHRDRDVVIDPAAWAAWGPGMPVIPDVTEDEMGSVVLGKNGDSHFGCWVEDEVLMVRGFSAFGVPLPAVAIPAKDPHKSIAVERGAIPTVDAHGRIMVPAQTAGQWVMATPGPFGYVAETI